MFDFSSRYDFSDRVLCNACFNAAIILVLEDMVASKSDVSLVMELVNSCWDVNLDSFSWDVISRTCNSIYKREGGMIIIDMKKDLDTRTRSKGGKCGYQFFAVFENTQHTNKDMCHTFIDLPNSSRFDSTADNFASISF